MLRPMLLLLLFLILAPLPWGWAAKDQSDLPPGASAEVIEKKVRDQAREELLKKKAVETPLVEEEEKPLVKRARLVPFLVRKIHLEGGELLPPEVLAPLFAEYEGRELTHEDLDLLSRKIEEVFRSKGYFAVVYFPAQEIKEGEVTLELIVSRMGKLHVEGTRYSCAWKIRSYWKIPEGEILRYDGIRQSIRPMQTADRSVQSILKAGKTPATTDIYLKVTDRLPVHLGFSFNNQGVKTTGRENIGFSFRHHNLLGLDDTFQTGTSFGQVFGSFYFNHLIPVTNFGTRLVYGYSYANVTPEKEFKINGINAVSQTYSLALYQKVIDTDRLILDTHFGLDFKEKATKQLSVTAVWDRLRIFTLGADLTRFDGTGNWSAGQEISLSTSPHGDGFALNSRGAESHFFKYEFSLKRAEKLPWGTVGIASLRGQLSPAKLPPQEELFLGGAASVRGYPESDYGADQAILTRVEWNTPFFLVPASWKLPFSGGQILRHAITLITFLDYGYGRLNDPSGSERRRRALMGAGGGFSVQFRKNLSARFELGAVLRDRDHPLTEGGNSQFHFRLQAEV